MKNILKITIIVFAMANFAVAQSTSYFKWIGKHPDEAAEDVALQFDKAGDKLVSIDDTENFGYDERGQRNTKIESTTRVLVFESGTQLDIRFNPISQITKLTFNLKNTPSYFQLKSQLNLNALKVIEENDNYVCFEGLGLGVNVTIHEVKSPLGLINNEYTVELSKNSPKKYFNPTVFNIDSIDITNSYQTIANHINANLTTKGFKYLNQTDLIPITTSDKSLSYYILNNNYSEGVNINFQLYPSKKVKTIIINSTNPITKIKLGKLFFDELLTSIKASNKEFIEQKNDPSDLKPYLFEYNNNEYYRDPDTKNIIFFLYHDKTEIASTLKNTAIYSIETLLTFNDQRKRLQNLLCNVHYSFEDNAIEPCSHGTHIVNWPADKKKDEHDIVYFLSPDQKMVKVTYCNKIGTDHPVQIYTKDLLFVEKLKKDFQKTKIFDNRYTLADETNNGFKVLNKAVVQSNSLKQKQDVANQLEEQRIADIEQQRRSEANRQRREKELQETQNKIDQWSGVLNQILQKKPKNN